MNVDTVKRLVALNRQASSYRAMVRNGDLTHEEADMLITEIDGEIANIRSQKSLPLKTETDPAVQAGASPEGRSKK